MCSFEVLKRCGSTQVERVLSNAAVASARTLAARNVREAMLDGDALPEPITPTRRSNEMPEALLERLVGSDSHLAASVHRLGAFRAR